jgi:predicted ATP-grasp superfamily ATP-dependent carboligase
LAKGETLIFQPWLKVIREYGVVMEISRDGACELQGISDLQTNGAGTGTGYILGRTPSSHRAMELERIAFLVSERLFKEGYYGPVGIDALEHAGGFHPLLEINARYTMGFVAAAVERSLKPAAPTFWSTKTDYYHG